MYIFTPMATGIIAGMFIKNYKQFLMSVAVMAFIAICMFFTCLCFNIPDRTFFEVELLSLQVVFYIYWFICVITMTITFMVRKIISFLISFLKSNKPNPDAFNSKKIYEFFNSKNSLP